MATNKSTCRCALPWCRGRRSTFPTYPSASSSFRRCTCCCVLPFKGIKPPFPSIPVLPLPGLAVQERFRTSPTIHITDLIGCAIYESFFHTRTKAVTLIHMRADHTNPPYTDDTRQLATGRPSHIHMRADDTDQSYTTNIDQFSLSTRPHPHEARLALHRTCNHREAEIPTQFLFSHKSPEM